jgi:hypothetical protein
MAESLLLRVQKLDSGIISYPVEVIHSITRLFISEAQARIQKHATDALMAFATGDELVIMLKGIKRFSRYPAVNTVKARRKIAQHLIDGNSYTLEF